MSKYEQAIKLLEMLSSDEFQQFTSSEFDDAIYTAIEALEKADKYRWHDLRKNPDDLPRVTNGYGESDYVLVKTGCFEWCDMEMAYYSYAKKQWSIDNYVFAWQYIEPFEEEEECVSD